MTTVNNERQNMPSASSFARYQSCPGSWQLEQRARELGQLANQGGKDADRGTRIHAWLAGETVELNEEELDAGWKLRERGEEQKRRIFGDAPYLHLKEKRVWLNA